MKCCPRRCCARSGRNFQFAGHSSVVPACASTSACTAASSTTTSLLITTLEETRHNLSDNDVVVLSEVQGMEYLNNQQFVVAKVKDAYNFEVFLEGDIAQTASDGGYIRGGYINQV